MSEKRRPNDLLGYFKRVRPAPATVVEEHTHSDGDRPITDNNSRLPDQLGVVAEVVAPPPTSNCTPDCSDIVRSSSSIPTLTTLGNPGAGTGTNARWPEDWDEKQWFTFREKYSWLEARDGNLGCIACSSSRSLGIGAEKGAIAFEWMHYDVRPSSSESRTTRLSSLRKKNFRHNTSELHLKAENISKLKSENAIESDLQKQSCRGDIQTERVFRCVYYIAKNDRPFSDLPGLIELQKMNGLDMGVILHSRYSATQIVEFLATEISCKIVKNMIKINTKLSVLIDESTTASQKTALVVNIKAVVGEEGHVQREPVFLFLALIELETQTAEGITTALLKCLKVSGFTEEYLQKNWISFTSDGASVMTGKRSGVGERRRQMYPQLFLWHCMNHRLELAVGDAVNDVTALNHFQAFVDSLHKVCSQSPKNNVELTAVSVELGAQLLKIGRVLSNRWVSSSYRTVNAFWITYEALHKHFVQASEDLSRGSTERRKIGGLAQRLASPEFLLDLALMHDALHELSTLSVQLQDRKITLEEAHRKVDRTIRVLDSFKDVPGEAYSKAQSAVESGAFQGVPLAENPRLTQINPQQFLQSLCDRMRRRLLDIKHPDFQLLSDMKILNQDRWPPNPNLRYSENEVRRLCHRFALDAQKGIVGMRELIDSGKPSPYLRPLHQCLQTLPCSTAECERSFSAMNIILSDLRSSLTIQNVPKSQGHRSSNDTQSRRVNCHENISNEETALWALF